VRICYIPLLLSSALLLSACRSAELVAPRSTTFFVSAQNLYTVEEEESFAIGAKSSDAFPPVSFPIVKDWVLQGYLNKVLAELTPAIPERLPHMQYHLRIIRDPVEADAYAFIGGNIFLSLEYIAQCETLDRLVGTVGHELGHASLRHFSVLYTYRCMLQEEIFALQKLCDDKQIRKDPKEFRMVVLALEMRRNLIGSAVRKMQQSQELEADAFAAMVMARAGFRPTLLAEHYSREAYNEAGSLELFSTHPNYSRRALVVADEARAHLGYWKPHPELERDWPRMRRRAELMAAEKIQPLESVSPPGGVATR